MEKSLRWPPDNRLSIPDSSFRTVVKYSFADALVGQRGPWWSHGEHRFRTRVVQFASKPMRHGQRAAEPSSGRSPLRVPEVVDPDRQDLAQHPGWGSWRRGRADRGPPESHGFRAVSPPSEACRRATGLHRIGDGLGLADVPSECQQCLGRLKTVHFIEGSVQGRFATAGGTPWPAVLRACIQTSPPQEEQRWSFEPGQSDLDASTAQGTVGDRDRPVVVDDDLLHDRQAEARPALVSGSCGV